jgi:Glycosyl transferase WecG/TagA/CpsF family
MIRTRGVPHWSTSWAGQQCWSLKGNEEASTPRWIQRRGLEGAFRLSMEPRRLWRRYARAVPLFIFLLSRQYLERRLATKTLRSPNQR